MTQGKKKRGPNLAAHPAADLLPLMSDEEYEGLKEDIRRHGQREAIILLDGKILDGRHRDRACRELGVEPRTVSLAPDLVKDPVAYVRSVNLHRRHLTALQKRAVVAGILQDDPKQSDRAAAARAGVDHKTVAAVRKAITASGEIPQSETRVGQDGRERAARLTRLAEASQAQQEADELAAEAKRIAGKSIDEKVLLAFESASQMADFAEAVRKARVSRDYHQAAMRYIKEKGITGKPMIQALDLWWYRESGQETRDARRHQKEEAYRKLRNRIHGGDVDSWLSGLGTKVKDMTSDVRLAMEAARYCERPRIKDGLDAKLADLADAVQQMRTALKPEGPTGEVIEGRLVTPNLLDAESGK
jgi:ParB-like chromosome segregation protein Spo0J